MVGRWQTKSGIRVRISFNICWGVLDGSPPRHPILVIGNTHDPSTPYEGAIAIARELARTRLLTVGGYGHTVFNPSQCASKYITHYFINGQLPPQGTICKQDYQPLTPISGR